MELIILIIVGIIYLIKTLSKGLTKKRVLNLLSIIILFSLTFLLPPTIFILEECYNLSINFPLGMGGACVLLIVGVWLGMKGGWWNGGEV